MSGRQEDQDKFQSIETAPLQTLSCNLCRVKAYRSPPKAEVGHEDDAINEDCNIPIEVGERPTAMQYDKISEDTSESFQISLVSYVTA